MGVYFNDKRFIEYTYKLENELERDVVNNSKLFFGPKSIYIDAKKKIQTKFLGGSIPDGFLFDFSDKENPNFYIVEAELSKHDFYGHIFPQITKFFAFFNHSKSQNELVNKLYSIIIENEEIKEQFDKLLDEKELYKFIKDTIENNQNILIVIDGEKNELPSIMETYSETWGSMVKLLILKKYQNEEEFLFTLEPEFEYIDEVTHQHFIEATLESSDNEEAFDTIVIPAKEEGFKRVFLGEKCWYGNNGLSISISMLDKIKYIAAYEVAPTSSITHLAKVRSIEKYNDTDRYIVYFEEIKKIKNIPLPNERGQIYAPRSPRYSNIERIKNAKTLKEVFWFMKG